MTSPYRAAVESCLPPVRQGSFLDILRNIVQEYDEKLSDLACLNTEFRIRLWDPSARQHEYELLNGLPKAATEAQKDFSSLSFKPPFAEIRFNSPSKVPQPLRPQTQCSPSKGPANGCSLEDVSVDLVDDCFEPDSYTCKDESLHGEFLHGLPPVTYVGSKDVSHAFDTDEPTMSSQVLPKRSFQSSRDFGASRSSRSARISICSHLDSEYGDGLKFMINEGWTREITSFALRGRSNKSIQNYAEQMDDEPTDYSAIEKYDGFFRHFIGLPHSKRRIAWEVFGVILIMYDLFALPLLAFDPPENPVTSAINYCTLLFWTFNMGASCTVGYIDEGTMVLDPRKICERYLRTWFLIDFVVVLPDWFFTVSALLGDGGTGAGSSVKLLRILRLVRLTRLLRLLKLRKAWNMLYDLVDSEKVGIILNIFKMIFVLLLVNHFTACAWFLVGNMQAGPSWLKYHGFTRDDVAWGHQYVTAYHWSITQFTPSSMHVQPHSIGERIFAIVVVVFALVGFSYLVGSITGSLAQLRSMGEEETKLFWNLRRFLKKNKVDKVLYARILSYCEARWQHQQEHVPTGQVEILKLLSDQLQHELQSAIHSPSLRIHPLLNRLAEDSVVTLRRIANHVLSTQCLACYDLLFIAGEVSKFLAVVLEGKLKYKYVDGDDRDPEIVSCREDWIAEPVLWLSSWNHLGDLFALSAAELMKVDPKEFLDIVHRNPVAYRLVATYAQRYVEWMNSEDYIASDISQGEDPTLKELLVSFCE